MREEISLLQVFISATLGFGNLIMYVILLVLFPKSLVYRVFYLTNWGLWANTLYLLVVAICDIIFFIKKNKDIFSEKINCFFRNCYSLVSFTFSYSIFLLYWVILACGGFSEPNGGEKKFLDQISFRNIYVHGLISVFVLIDLFTSEHEKKEITITYALINTGVYYCYCTVALCATYCSENHKQRPYAFLESPLYILIPIGIGFNIVIVGFYCLQVFLTRFSGIITKKKTQSDSNASQEEEMTSASAKTISEASSIPEIK